LDRAHVLLPPGYCEEWWIKELEEKLVDKGLIFKFKNCKISFDDAFFISNEYNIPLHPRFTFHWKDVTGGDVFEVLTKIAKTGGEGSGEKKQNLLSELLKRVKSIGRNPQNMETWGKSLDVDGQVFVITADLRREYMRKAIGGLTDIPVKLPEAVADNAEAGATAKVSADVESLQNEVKELRELIAQNVANHTNGQVPSPSEKVEVPSTPEVKEELTGSMLRQSLLP